MKPAKSPKQQKAADRHRKYREHRAERGIHRIDVDVPRSVGFGLSELTWRHKMTRAQVLEMLVQNELKKLRNVTG